MGYKNCDKLTSQQILELAQKEYDRVIRYVEAPSRNPLVMTPELRAWAEKEATKVREHYKAIADERKKEELSGNVNLRGRR